MLRRVIKTADPDQIQQHLVRQSYIMHEVLGHRMMKLQMVGSNVQSDNRQKKVVARLSRTLHH